VKLKKKGWYIDVRFLERLPITSETILREYTDSPWLIDAEGIVARQVQLSSATHGAVCSAELVRRHRKAATPLFRTTSQEVSRLTKAAEVQLSSL
jgi:hypothetical protein